MRRLLAAIILSLLPLAPSPVLAGTTGSFAGTVVNQDGEPVAGALVSAASPAATCNTRSDVNGFYICVLLPPDTYQLSIEKEGYSPQAIHAAVFADAQPRRRIQLFSQAFHFQPIGRRSFLQPLVRPDSGDDLYEVPVGY